MTEIPLSCDPDTLPSTDDLLLAIGGALDAASYLRWPRFKMAVAKSAGRWVLRHGRPDESLRAVETDVSPSLARARPGELARDLIDRYRPHHTEDK